MAIYQALLGSRIERWGRRERREEASERGLFDMAKNTLDNMTSTQRQLSYSYTLPLLYRISLHGFLLGASSPSDEIGTSQNIDAKDPGGSRYRYRIVGGLSFWSGHRGLGFAKRHWMLSGPSGGGNRQALPVSFTSRRQSLA